jgi:hypothetical protein
MAENIKVATREVGGQPIEVFLTPHLSFVAIVNGDEIFAPTWNELEPKVKRALAVSRVEHAIPVVLEGRQYQRAILRGRHQGKRSTYLFLLDGAKTSIEYPKILALDADVSDSELAALNQAAENVAQAHRIESNLVQIIKKRSAGRYIEAGRLIEDAEKALVGPSA